MKKFFLIFSVFCLLASFVPGSVFEISASAQTLPDPPQIISRSQWGADESLKTWAEEYQTDDNGYTINKAKYIVVHHTASSSLTPDNDDSGRYTGMVQAIYRWHTINATWDDYQNGTVRGFGDIGYNYLIDPNGNIYEGRSGANGVIGAHAYGHNTGTIGIALIGTYGATLNGQYVSHEISPAVKESLNKLVGWLAAANGIDLNNQILIDGAYKYPLVGHKDVRPTACPGDELYALLGSVRQQANVYAQGYASYVYQVAGSSKIFLVRDGLRREYESLQHFQNTGLTYAKLVPANSLYLTLFPTRAFLKYPDGSLLQEIGQNTIYYLEGGKKRALDISAEQFTKLGFAWSSVIQIDSLDIKMYEDGLAIKFGPEGKLIQDSQGRVYLIENGKKRWVVSGTLFAHLGYSWSKVTKDAQAENYLNGEIMRYKSGTLVRDSSPDVFVVEGSSKRKITSLQLFNHLGYSWKNILQIASSELALYGLGDAMKYKDGTLIKKGEEPQIFLLADGQKRPFSSAEIFLARGYSWSQVLKLTAEEFNVYSLGAYVGYPEGTLMKTASGNRVFVIKNEAPAWIQSAQEFTRAGYKWSQIKTVTDAEFALLYPGVVTSDQPTSNEEPSGNNSPTTNAALGGEIKIGLKKLANAEEVRVTANGAFSQYDAGGAKVASFAAGQTAAVAAGASNYAKFEGDNSEVIMEVLSYTDSPAWKPSLNYNRFRGAIIVQYSSVSGASWLINELPMERYLQGIGEALNDDQPQYQRAFAIITRSYATFHLQNGGKRAGEIYHLNNTSSDQVYKGYVFETIASNLVQAVQATAGQVLKYNNKIARAVYSSDSGGTTTSACTKWGGEFCTADYGFLAGGVDDPEGTVHNQTKVTASHGVGMSCIGARRLAELGYTFEQILKYYYLGIVLEKIY